MLRGCHATSQHTFVPYQQEISQYAWVKAKTLFQSQFFNVDAKRLTAGYRQGNRVASAPLRVPRLVATGATQRQERDA
jgi:hypothetical protein